MVISLRPFLKSNYKFHLQDKLGSTCSTAPSNIEDNQSELSVSLSHQSELSGSLSYESVQYIEKDDLCHTGQWFAELFLAF